MADRRLEVLPGTLEMLVLRALQQGPQHGYSIARWIARTSDSVLQVEEGSLYPALYRLEQRGLVDSEWGASESNRRAKFYRLTKGGRAELSQQRSSWEKMSTAIAQVLDGGAPARAQG
jgi:transcriptional regulator